MKRALIITIALATGGCMVDSQRFTRRPDGSYTMSVKTWALGMNARADGIKSEWQTEDALYGDSISNINTTVETKLVEAIAEGVAAGLAKGVKP